MNTLATAFGAAVWRLRSKEGQSQEAFAHSAGVSRTYMSEIERGVTNVSLQTVERLALALALPMARLLEETEKERSRARRS